MKKVDESRGIVINTGYGSYWLIVFDVFMLIACYFYGLKKNGFQNSHPLVYLCLIATFSILIIRVKRSEIIFKDEKVYCCYGFRKNVYDISSIVCVKCAITYISSSHIMNPYVKNSDGSYAQTMFYLKETKDGMELKENSYNFERKFNRSILFSSVYDERVLKYLKIVNPNIVIMECED